MRAQRAATRAKRDRSIYRANVLAAIESVAKAHLDFVEARVAWRKALDAGDVNLEQRDALEQAALQVQSVSDTAYFYAGLAFGLVFVYVHRTA